MKRTLTPAELRRFGFTFAGAIAFVFGLVLPWLFDYGHPRWPWIVAAVISLPALLVPRALAPLYAVWMRIALVIGFVNTRIILGLLFFLIIWPFGLALRLAGKLQYQASTDAEAKSYRVSVSAERDREEYERPF